MRLPLRQGKGEAVAGILGAPAADDKQESSATRGSRLVLAQSSSEVGARRARRISSGAGAAAPTPAPSHLTRSCEGR
jgi:hypothetical protein